MSKVHKNPSAALQVKQVTQTHTTHPGDLNGLHGIF